MTRHTARWNMSSTRVRLAQSLPSISRHSGLKEASEAVAEGRCTAPAASISGCREGGPHMVL